MDILRAHENNVTQFINQTKIESRVKIETFLSTFLDIRKCSYLTIPTDFPDSIELGTLIDEQVQPQIMNLQQIKDPKIRSVGVQAIQKMLQKKFTEIVEESESYHLHMKWADDFKLKSTQMIFIWITSLVIVVQA